MNALPGNERVITSFSPIRQRTVFKRSNCVCLNAAILFKQILLYWRIFIGTLTPFFINWKYTVLMSELCTRRQQETVKYLSLFYPTKCKTVFDANLTMEQFASKCIFIRLASWWPVIVSVWFEQTHSTWQCQFELPCQQSNLITSSKFCSHTHENIGFY